MDDMRKINEHYKKNNLVGASDIYRKFSVQFDQLFHSEEIATDKKEFENMYVSDELFENDINNFRKLPISMVKFCVGYTGIGKTTSLRHCFNLGVSREPQLNISDKELVFPTFFDGLQSEKDFLLHKRIAAVCTTLEDYYPELRQLVKSEKGKTELYYFIRRHTSYTLENINPVDAMDMDDGTMIKEKLKKAYEESPFEFQANRLKYYISKKYDDIQSFVIILDDIESLSEDFQEKIIVEFLKFHNCMKHTDYPQNLNYCVKLLMSIRPHTHRIFNKTRLIESYSIKEPAIMKKYPIDLNIFFQKRFEYYTKKCQLPIGNIDTWKECYEELMKMNHTFEGKYKDMIINLCFMNIREALAAYSRIFANRFWVQKNKQKEEYFSVKSIEYHFNNINVIRALACDEESMYCEVPNTILPNIFDTSKSYDNTIFCLLVMEYFYKNNDGEAYGLNAKSISEIQSEWKNIFGEKMSQKFVDSMKFLFVQKILRKSLKDEDDYRTLDKIESLTETSRLYISPRGMEMYEMRSRDSVLLEMLRENAWRDYGNRNYSFLSSSDLMKDGKQIEIFFDLLEYVDFLCEREDDVLAAVKICDSELAYKHYFNETMITKTLLLGIYNSLEYSGYLQEHFINEKYKKLSEKINRIERNF